MPIHQSIGVLLVNLGTPDAPTPAAVRRFLKQFLWDPRVVEFPRVLWWLVLNGIILRIRPSRSAAAYREIWTDEGSPLLLNSLALADGVKARLEQNAPGRFLVEPAMTYGEPSIPAAIDRLQEAGARRMLVLPLYPQYSGTTTASVFDAVTSKLQTMRWVPETRFINQYHDVPDYIEALAVSIEDYWREHGRGTHLLYSFHGVPQYTVDGGDPYGDQCQETARLLSKRLGLSDDAWTLAFQSRVGRAEWLRPYTDETVARLGRDGLDRLDVACPGFATDCLETLEEIAMQNGEFFTENGGGELRYIPALNARADHVVTLANLVEQHAAGWPEVDA